MSFDWAELMKDAEKALEVPPAVEYSFTVMEAIAKTSAKGNPMIATKMKIDVGPHAGTTVLHWFNMIPDNPKQLAFFFRDMAHFGMDSTFFGKGPSFEEVAANLLGRRFDALTKHQDFEGSAQLRIATIKKSLGVASGNGASPMTPGATTGPSVPSGPTVPSMLKTPSITPPVPPTI